MLVDQRVYNLDCHGILDLAHGGALLFGMGHIGAPALPLACDLHRSLGRQAVQGGSNSSNSRRFDSRIA